MLILITTLLISIANTVFGCIYLWHIKYWFEYLYAPLILFLASIFIMLIFWWCFIWLMGRFVPKKLHQKPSKWSRFWLETGHDFAMIVTRVHIKVSGKDKIPNNQKFLLVCNHRSNWDPMVMIAKLKKYHLSFLTKKSNYDIPLFGRFLYGCCFYPLQRDDKLQSLSIFQKSADLISKGYASVGVFPQGTRYRDEPLSPFHEGVMNIALRAKCPIVIVTVAGAEMVLHNYPWRSTKVYIDVLGVLNYEDIQDMTAKAISDKVYDIMSKHLEKIDIMKYQAIIEKRQHKRI